MKLFKVILLIFLVAKASVGGAFSSISPSSCCGEKTSEICGQEVIEVEKGHNDKPMGCCGEDLICDCICCSHVFMEKTLYKLAFAETSIDFIHKHFFSLNYERLKSFSIWQPPKK